MPFFVSAGNSGDNGYDDIDGFFGYCSSLRSPGVRYTYISKLMMKRVANLSVGDSDLKPIGEKIDFIQSVYVTDGVGDTRECAHKVEELPQKARENGFECVMSINKDGSCTNIYMKKGEGGLNSLLMTNVCYVDGKIDFAVAALIGGVFTYEEILSLMKF
jgi:hypothetical protein